MMGSVCVWGGGLLNGRNWGFSRESRDHKKGQGTDS